MNTMVHYSLITATYNEAENIQDFLRALASTVRPLGRSFEIVVVDDNSPDGTGRLVEDLRREIPEIRLITRTIERGIGSAFRRGIQVSSGRVITTMDADFSHPPAALPELLAAADTGALVLGSRFLRSGDFETLWYRRLPTRIINRWHRLLLNTSLNDHTNGYIAVPREALDRLLAEGDGRGIPPFERILYGLVLVALARRLGIPVIERPARYVFRTRGETKIRFGRGVLLFFEEWLDSLRLLPARYGDPVNTF
ncbi:MAG TPA: glycosyltransferase [Terriglobales bacterium]|nr:glycosyltransferase [Terriglobales bacterium]